MNYIYNWWAHSEIDLADNHDMNIDLSREIDTLPHPAELSLRRHRSFPSSTTMSRTRMPGLTIQTLNLDQSKPRYDPLLSASSFSAVSSFSSTPTTSARPKSPPPRPQASEDLLIVLDWDDTLFPTHAISQMVQQSSSDLQTGESSNLVSSLAASSLESLHMPQSTQQVILQLEALGMQLVRLCKSKGAVMVVTNSDQGWVEYTASLYMPNLLDLMQELEIPVVSARARFEHLYPNDLAMWKHKVFLAELMKRQCVLSRIVSIGDGEYERDAAKACSIKVPHIHVQTMKLMAWPSMEQLRRQLVLSESILVNLLSSHSSFDVNLVA